MKKIYLSLLLFVTLMGGIGVAEAAITSTTYPYTMTKNTNGSWTITVQNPTYSSPGDPFYVPANYAITASSVSEYRNQVIYRFQYDLPGTNDGHTFYVNMATSFGAAYDDLAAKTGTTYTGTIIATSTTDSFTANGFQTTSVNIGDTVTFAWSAANTTQTDSFYQADQPDKCPSHPFANGNSVSVPWVANTQIGTYVMTIDPCMAGRTYTYTFQIYRPFATVLNKTVILRVSNNTAQTGNGSAVSNQIGDTGNTSQINIPIVGTTTVGIKNSRPALPSGSLGNRTYTAPANDIQNQLIDLGSSLVETYERNFKDAAQFRGQKSDNRSNDLSSSATASLCTTLTSNLRTGDSGSQVNLLTTVLVSDGDMTTAQTNFDQTVFSAVVRYQEKYADKILVPAGLDRGTGFVGPATRSYINTQLCSSNS